MDPFKQWAIFKSINHSSAVDKSTSSCTISAGVGFAGSADLGNSFKQKDNLGI